MESQKISVVTVCYNAVTVIEETMLSVLNQTYPNVEYIIIDGGSTDGTVDIIKKYAEKLAYWVSEPDKGIYDAMNKGIAVATGEYLNFMNAGDSFHNNDVIRSVFSKKYPLNCNVIYGKTKVTYKMGTYIVTPPKIKTLLKKMCLCHQSIFVKTQAYRNNKFDVSYKVIADYVFLLHLYQQTPDSFFFYHDVVSNYDAVGGFSYKNIALMKDEYQRVHKNENNNRNVNRFVKSLIPIFLRKFYRRILFYFNPNIKRTP